MWTVLDPDFIYPLIYVHVCSVQQLAMAHNAVARLYTKWRTYEESAGMIGFDNIDEIGKQAHSAWEGAKKAYGALLREARVKRNFVAHHKKKCEQLSVAGESFCV